jgi:hypothetical protein
MNPNFISNVTTNHFTSWNVLKNIQIYNKRSVNAEH